MELISKLRSGVEQLARTAYFQQREREQARQSFIANRDSNMFFGVHDSWQQASQACNAFGKRSYDNEESAALYDHRTRIDTYDYPALVWLLRSMLEGMRSVGDLGGSIGIKFLAFRETLSAWPDLQWTVHDVPAAVERGRKLAESRGDADRLRFADHVDQLQACDILFVSGVLQYLPATLGETMGQWRTYPRRIIINTTPIHPTLEFFTVNSLGSAFCPYRVQTQANLIRGLTQLGYKLRASWINPDKLMTIPMDPEHSLKHYSGFCLDQKR